MIRLLSAIKRVILWSYERGSRPYDVLVVLILAFIFLTPNYLFKKSARVEAVYDVSIEELAKENHHQTIQELLSAHLRKKTRVSRITITRFEPKFSSDGRILGYKVWVKQAN